MEVALHGAGPPVAFPGLFSGACAEPTEGCTEGRHHQDRLGGFAPFLALRITKSIGRARDPSPQSNPSLGVATHRLRETCRTDQ
eukprot:symbB.v1.2.007830.t1/scaffold463.1/size291460/11